MTSSYLFIDAESLNHAIAEFSETYVGEARLKIDLSRLRAQHRKVFFYDAIPVQGRDEGDAEYLQRVAPKRAELAIVERIPGFHVRTGDVHRRKGRGNEQKMVDVHLAVDALLMASRGLFTEATLMTSDLDFRPLVTALVEMGIDVSLQYRPRATNDDLIAAADNAYAISDRMVASWIDQKATPFLAPYDCHNFIWDEDHYARQVAHLEREWDDVTHGRCGLYTDPDPNSPDWLLVVHRFPDMPTHNLEVRGNDLGVLRTWAQRNHDCTIPE